MNYSDSPNNIILRFNPKGLDNCIISCSDGSEMKLTTEANTYVTYMADCWPHPQKPVDSASRRTDPVCDDEISISGSGNSWITHPAKKWLKLGESGAVMIAGGSKYRWTKLGDAMHFNLRPEGINEVIAGCYMKEERAELQVRKATVTVDGGRLLLRAFVLDAILLLSETCKL